MTRILFLCFLIAAVLSRADSPNTEPADAGAGGENLQLSAPASELLADIGGKLAVMDEHAVIIPPDAAEAVLLALIKSSDPMAAILTDDEAKRVKEEEQGIFQETGLKLRMSDQLPAVDDIIEGSPASKTDIKLDEKIEKIGDTPLSGMPLADVEAMLRGEEGRELELWLKPRSADAEPRKIELRIGPTAKPVIEFAEKWPQNICYARINGLYRGSGEVLRKALAKWDLDQTFGLIMDLRGSAGVDLQAASEAAGLFLPPNTPLFKAVNGRGETTEAFSAITPPDTAAHIKMPLVILVNAETRGASELLAAILQNRARALLIGTPTAGDAAARKMLPLDDNKFLHMAVARPSLDGAAAPNQPGPYAVPDILISHEEETRFANGYAPEKKTTGAQLLSEHEIDAKGLRNRIGNDAVLSRAADILMGLKALNIREH